MIMSYNYYIQQYCQLKALRNYLGWRISVVSIVHNPFATIQLCKMRLKGLSACENCISFHSYCFSAGVDNICPLTASFQELVAQQASASIFPASPKMVHWGHFGPFGLSSESPLLDDWCAEAKLLRVSPPPSDKWPSVNSVLIQSHHNRKPLQSSTSDVDDLLQDQGRDLGIHPRNKWKWECRSRRHTHRTHPSFSTHNNRSKNRATEA